MSTAGLNAVRLAVEEVKTVITTLSDAEWAMPSGCEGWSVKDLVSHMSSNYKEVVEPSPPPAEPIDLPAERLMDLLVEPRKLWSKCRGTRRIPDVLRWSGCCLGRPTSRTACVNCDPARRPRDLPDAQLGRCVRVRPLLPPSGRPAGAARTDRTRCPGR